MTLKEYLESITDFIEKNYRIRIYSIRNHSVVGHILNQKPLIPENVYGYRYISMKIEDHPINDRKIPDYILVITVE